MSVLYVIFRMGEPVSTAIRQLSKKFLHLREGKTGLLDAFFEAYLDAERESGIGFEDWLNSEYDRTKVKEDLLKSGRGKLQLDRLLRRE